MGVFRDHKQREWTVRFTTGLLRKVRDKTGIDLFKAMNSADGLSSVLFGDQEKFVATLCELCRAEVDERQVSEDEFADLFDGPTIEQATTALLEAVADFSPLPKTRAAAKQRARATLDQIDNAMLVEMEKPITNNPAGS